MKAHDEKSRRCGITRVAIRTDKKISTANKMKLKMSIVLPLCAVKVFFLFSASFRMIHAFNLSTASQRCFMATQMLNGNREQRFGNSSETCDPNSGYPRKFKNQHSNLNLSHTS